VSADEILTAPPRVKYKDILISRKSGSNDEQSGHSSRKGHTHTRTHTRTHTHDDSNSRSFNRNDLLKTNKTERISYRNIKDVLGKLYIHSSIASVYGNNVKHSK
jgi:hypothetical protein